MYIKGYGVSNVVSSKMWKILAFISFLGSGWAQTAPPGVADELYNIFYGLPISFPDCSNVNVEESHLVFTLYTQENRETGTVITDNNLNVVNPLLRSIWIAHGWLESHREGWITEMKDELLNQSPVNVFIVDWSQYAVINYGTAVCAVPQVGKIIGSFIYKLIQTVKLTLPLVEMIGFSLGCHVSGFAGQEVQLESGGEKIARIACLDGAGPGYQGRGPEHRASPDDAVAVHAIHTNRDGFGYGPFYGTADFYVNCFAPTDIVTVLGCGTFQPCCPINPGLPKSDVLTNLKMQFACHHHRALAYYTASITSNNFLAVPCSCYLFGTNSCRSYTPTVMGENCAQTAAGPFYLNPNGVAPFPKGIEGTGGIGGLGGPECLPSEY